ncbi:hypothetical protein EV421DRAFT_512076 [Armillaria borealis]|uniref:F-box domain-containing protein n=1 Tax=Armillaria borealis TaxID=47425 RepID=A0AA39JNQ7_9AGAR|nr:hypothetical protein EV421DRAFT_512076 [Armillaria borealis]
MSCLTCSNCGFVNLLRPEPHVQQNLNAIQSSDDLVSQLLRGSRPLLDADHAFIDAAIAKLERLRCLYDDQLQGIQTRCGPVLKSLENHRSVYAPIRRLPRDVLIEIFHLVCAPSNLGEGAYWASGARNHDSLDLSGPLWVLGRVCGLWRDTLHTSPASWAQNVVLKSPFSKHAPEILQTYLEHTGEHPLNLTVTCDRPNAGASEIMSLVIQSCYRWKKVCIFTHLNHTRSLDSISHLPVLQTITLDVLEDHNFDYRLDMCLNAPQLWQASLSSQGMHQVRLPPSITHYSGCITGVEDFQLLSHLPKLRTCSLRPFWKSSVKLRVEAPVIMAELRHLSVDCADFVNFITAPLLQHLTVFGSPEQKSACITSFLHRSGCHLESFSCIERTLVELSSESPALIGNMLSSEACSTVSRLKVQLDPQVDQVAEALSLPSVLPNLRHLILCIVAPAEKDEWYPILDMIRSRRDAGLIKIVELQFADDECASMYGYDIIAETRALAGDRLEMRVEAWNPPAMEDWARFHGSTVIG